MIGLCAGQHCLCTMIEAASIEAVMSDDLKPMCDSATQLACGFSVAGCCSGASNIV